MKKRAIKKVVALIKKIAVRIDDKTTIYVEAKKVEGAKERYLERLLNKPLAADLPIRVFAAKEMKHKIIDPQYPIA